MEARTRIILPSIHIKKEKNSDNEAEDVDPSELLHYYNNITNMPLDGAAPILIDDSDITVVEVDVEKNIEEDNSSFQVAVNSDLDCSTPTRNITQHASSKDVNQNSDVCKSMDEAKFRDILTETIDCVARGNFDSDKSRWKPQMRPKGSLLNRNCQRHNKVNLKSKEFAAILCKPFDLNWRRELVHRSASTENMRMADAYYFSPSGKKLRSLPEVAAYLEKTNDKTLSINSFTFHKGRISNSPHETERYAKRRSDFQEHLPPSRKVTRGNEVKMKKELLEDSNSSCLSKAETEERDDVPKIHLDATWEDKEKKKNTDDVYKKNNGEINGETNGETNGEDDGMPRCSNNCPGQEGIIPSLHCSSCLCLFHPSCIGITNDAIEILQFTCKECQGKDGSPMANDVMSMSKSGEDNIGNASKIMHSVFPNKTASNIGLSIVDAHSNFNPDVIPSSKKKCIVNPTTSNLQSPVIDKQVQLPLINATTSGDAKHFPCGVTIEKVANPVSRLGPTEPDAASISLIRVPQQVSIPVTQTSTTISPKSIFHPNMRFILPTQTTSRLAVMSPNGLMTPISQQPRTSFAFGNSTMTPLVHLPTVFATSICQVKSVLPSSYTFTVAKSVQTATPHPLTRIMSAPAEAVNTYSRVPNITAQFKVASPNDINLRTHPQGRPASEHAYNKQTESTSKTNVSSNQENCWIRTLHGSFEGLLHVFRYLSLSDLHHASMVCQTWKKVSVHPFVWQHVVLRNMRITSWERFAKIVKANGTRRLDMRGMCLYDDKNRTWHEFASILSELKGLSRVDIGEVPAAIVHTITNTLTQLKGLSAEWIVDSTKEPHNASGNCRLFIGKLCQMPQLTTLRIRGVYGLYLPSPSFGLDCLEVLKHLKHVSLTSFKFTTAPDLNFLKTLKCLKVLELGDCHEWNVKSFEVIGDLTQLEDLRLEFKRKPDTEELMLALKDLKNLIRLDLIIFQIPKNLGEIISAMTKLKTVSIWPDISSLAAQNNYNTLQGLKRVPCLKSFTWGLVTSNLTGNKPGDKFDHQASNIPFLAAKNDGVLTEVKINAGFLMSKLRAALPSSKVQVMMVPNSSYSTIGCMPR